MAEQPTQAPDVAVDPIDAVTAAYEKSIAVERRVADERVMITQEAGKSDVILARLDIALVLMAIVSAKVAIGKPSLEERKVAMIVQLISERAGTITKQNLLEALDSFKDDSDTSK